jgi:hypothetical protein
MDKNEGYTILSDLIFKGFLTAEIELDRKLFIFKTINEKELELIKIYAGKSDRLDYITRFNTYFLIFSLFRAEQYNILEKREEMIPELYEYFQSIPEKLFKKILQDLSELINPMYDSLKYLEGFSYTNVSRNTWKSLNGLSPVAVDFTGISGTNKLGINLHQEKWIMINKSLDSEDEYNQKFYLALMIASSSNPKGARQIRGQHESQAMNAEDRRKKLAEDGSIEDVKRKWSAEGWAAPVDTAESLVAELERQIHGVKDKHDIFIEEYMKKLRDQAEKKTREAEERLKKYREEHDNVFIEGGQREATFDEVQGILSKKSPTTVLVHGEMDVKPEDKDKFFKKIGSRVLTNRE